MDDKILKTIPYNPFENLVTMQKRNFQIKRRFLFCYLYKTIDNNKEMKLEDLPYLPNATVVTDRNELRL